MMSKTISTIIILSMASIILTTPAAAYQTSVSVNAPESVDGDFIVTIELENVTDLDSGQFDLSFNSRVVNVTAVCDGNIGGTTVPISDWRFMDADTIRVLFDLPDADLVGGSRSLATVNFEMIGSVGDASVLDISNGELFDLDTYGEGMPARLIAR